LSIFTAGFLKGSLGIVTLNLKVSGGIWADAHGYSDVHRVRVWVGSGLNGGWPRNKSSLAMHVSQSLSD
jgi:hypothetical protein